MVSVSVGGRHPSGQRVGKTERPVQSLRMTTEGTAMLVFVLFARTCGIYLSTHPGHPPGQLSTLRTRASGIYGWFILSDVHHIPDCLGDTAVGTESSRGCGTQQEERLE